MYRSSALRRSSAWAASSLGVGVFQDWCADSGMKVAGAMKEGLSFEGGEAGMRWSMPLLCPLSEISLVPLGRPLGFSLSSPGGGRCSVRIVLRRRLIKGPFDTWSVSAASSSICSRAPRG